jgi:uncharacterized protein YdhG (YjbR/CyaY superfamily)
VEADPAVTAYVEGAPETERATLRVWLERCRGLPAPFTESLRYGMPCYGRGDGAELAFALQKRYLSLYVMRTDVMAEFGPRLAGLDVGKGCIRFPRSRPADQGLVADLVAAIGAATGPVC